MIQTAVNRSAFFFYHPLCNWCKIHLNTVTIYKTSHL